MSASEAGDWEVIVPKLTEVPRQSSGAVSLMRFLKLGTDNLPLYSEREKKSGTAQQHAQNVVNLTCLTTAYVVLVSKYS
jgi:hypothetical protein